MELERLSGLPVTGFRRARFGAFDRRALRPAGYAYDSSDNPIWLPGRYNNWGKPRTAYKAADGLAVLPVSASPLVRYPLFWLSFKHTPPALFRAVSRWTLARDGYLNLFLPSVGVRGDRRLRPAEDRLPARRGGDDRPAGGISVLVEGEGAVRDPGGVCVPLVGP